jgi:cold-inducible RNA-binding protein
VISDQETGRSRGFRFVTFVDEGAMNEAIKEMNGKKLDRRNITVNQAQSRGGGGGGGGGYCGGSYGGGGSGYGGGGRGSSGSGSWRNDRQSEY